MFSWCRRKKKDLDVLEMPSIPNPFPELCCSPFTSVLSAGLFPKANSRKKQVCILKFSNSKILGVLNPYNFLRYLVINNINKGAVWPILNDYWLTKFLAFEASVFTAVKWEC